MQTLASRNGLPQNWTNETALSLLVRKPLSTTSCSRYHISSITYPYIYSSCTNPLPFSSFTSHSTKSILRGVFQFFFSLFLALLIHTTPYLTPAVRRLLCVPHTNGARDQRKSRLLRLDSRAVCERTCSSITCSAILMLPRLSSTLNYIGIIQYIDNI